MMSRGNKTRPETTLFLLMSVDGKISTGVGDERDVDRDFPTIDRVKDGLYQYYEREQMTDLHSLNTGKVLAKTGINSKEHSPPKTDVSFIIIDSKPHVNQQSVLYLTTWLKKLIVVTTKENHPALGMGTIDNLEVLLYEGEIPFRQLFERLYAQHGIERLTIQSGGTLNSHLLRECLIDHVSLVVAPCLIGGRATPTIIDGVSILSKADLEHIKALELKKCEVLEHSYLHLRYDVWY